MKEETKDQIRMWIQFAITGLVMFLLGFVVRPYFSPNYGYMMTVMPEDYEKAMTDCKKNAWCMDVEKLDIEKLEKDN